MVKPEFSSFGSIKNLRQAKMTISQKIHGTNACIVVYENNGELDLVCGSRTRWIYPEDDNYGFATFVHKHKEEFIRLLGVGYHPGEWAGPGINSGEGLNEKRFVLFNWWTWTDEREKPPGCDIVPVLYDGPIDMSQIDQCMADLKENGSKLASGFMSPEGIVVSIAGVRFKHVFTPEESKWKNNKREKVAKEKVDYSHLLQPIRLEKLLSRDERFVRNYPETLPLIVKEYFEDLIKEGQIEGDDDQIKAVRKSASGQVFSFVKDVMGQ